MLESTRRIALWLLLGAFTTIAVAWVCSFFVMPGFARNGPSLGLGYVDQGDWRWLYSANRAFGSVDIFWTPTRISDGAVQTIPPNEHMVPRWSARAGLEAEQVVGEGPYQVEFVEQGRGWPLIAMRSWRKVHLGGFVGNSQGALQYIVVRQTIEQSGRIELGGWMKSSPQDQRSVPMWPVWPGFLANSAIFGTAWFVLLAGPRMFRWGVRRFRGRCPRCAYNLLGNLGSGCPECGWKRDAVTA